MKHTLLMAVAAIIGALTLSNSAQAASLCSVSEYFTTRSNPVAGCGTDDYLVYFSTSCDGEKPTSTKPSIYVPACRKTVAPREQQESAYLTTFIAQGYHVVGNYKLNDETTVFTLEK
jgi:hypothetical protein